MVRGADARATARAAGVLRAEGLVAATLPDADDEGALAFARAWGYDAVVAVGRTELRARRVSDGAIARWRSGEDAAALGRWARANAGDRPARAR